MNVSAFGPAAWMYLTCTALNASETPFTRANRALLLRLVHGILDTTPCRLCRESSQGFVKELPPEAFLYDRAGFCVWIYLFKAKVNAKLSRPNCTFRHYIAQHEQFRAKCAKKDGLGCTEPVVQKCEEEVDAWCRSALERYSDYPERIAAFRRRRSLEGSTKVALIVAGALFLAWLSAPRVRPVLAGRR